MDKYNAMTKTMKKLNVNGTKKLNNSYEDIFDVPN